MNGHVILVSADNKTVETHNVTNEMLVYIWDLLHGNKDIPAEKDSSAKEEFFSTRQAELVDADVAVEQMKAQMDEAHKTFYPEKAKLKDKRTWNVPGRSRTVSDVMEEHVDNKPIPSTPKPNGDEAFMESLASLMFSK